MQQSEGRGMLVGSLTPDSSSCFCANLVSCLPGHHYRGNNVPDPTLQCSQPQLFIQGYDRTGQSQWLHPDVPSGAVWPLLQEDYSRHFRSSTTWQPPRGAYRREATFQCLPVLRDSAVSLNRGHGGGLATVNDSVTLRKLPVIDGKPWCWLEPKGPSAESASNRSIDAASGHPESNPRTAIRSGCVSSPQPGLTCAFCKVPGHYVSRCRKLQKAKLQNSMFCQGRYKFWDFDQPIPDNEWSVDGTVNGQRVHMYRDTGSTMTFVNRKYVPHDAYLGESIRVRMVNGTVDEIPTTLVTLAVAGQQQQLWSIKQNFNLSSYTLSPE
ncbi:hypothetical protein Bbelb_295030 [Branchiostoma belcheri]|nr:hypothetical protein Bbelb_295030 [Branchiostoma belcheri]